jgi:ECF transporter S component (folate family)
MFNLKKIIYLSLFIAMEVIFTRFLSIQTPIVRIGFGFLPIAIAAMMFGPIYGGIMAGVADVLGMMLFPSGGAFFPGFTISACLSGVIYGVLLYQKPKTWIRITMAVVTLTIIITLGLNSIWLAMLTGQGIWAILPTRILKAIIMIPIQIIVIQKVWVHIASYAERILIKKHSGA